MGHGQLSRIERSKREKLYATGLMKKEDPSQTPEDACKKAGLPEEANMTDDRLELPTHKNFVALEAQ